MQIFWICIGLDEKGSFLDPGGGFGNNAIIFGIDMSSSVHVNNEKKNILILGEGPQGLDNTLLTAEKMYTINFSTTKKKYGEVKSVVAERFIKTLKKQDL